MKHRDRDRKSVIGRKHRVTRFGAGRIGVGLHLLEGQQLQRAGDIVHLVVFQLGMVRRLGQRELSIVPAEHQGLVAHHHGGDLVMGDVHHVPVQPLRGIGINLQTAIGEPGLVLAGRRT